MLSLDAELYVRLSPLTDNDHRLVMRNKCNPLQRIKVSFNTQLSAIASYVLTRMANNAALNIELTVQRLSKFVQVPLTLTISELMLIASMNDEAQLCYSFRLTSAALQTVQVPLQTAQVSHSDDSNNNGFISVPSPEFRGRDQIPIQMKHPSSPSWSEIPTSPSCTLFHTGISMYTDSFGTMPPSLAYCSQHERSGEIYMYNEQATKESIKLKQQLEAMISHSRQLSTV